jgi:hypothetical protein
MHCGCFLDSSVLLHAVFEEPQFSAKISLFEKSVIKYHLPIEVLPKVNLEVTRRMMVGSQEFVYILSDVVSEIESSAGKISLIRADSKALTLI